MNLLRRASLGASFLAALPRLGVTVTEGQDPVAALEARLTSAAAAPTAEAINAAAVALLTSAGLEVSEGQTVAQAIAALNSGLENAEQQVAQLTQQAAANSSASAQLTAFTTALAAVGIKPVAKDEKAGLTAADIQAAIEARISTRAAEQLAATGTQPAATEPTTEPSKANAKKSTTGGEIEAVAAIYRERFAAAGIKPAAK